MLIAMAIPIRVNLLMASLKDREHTTLLAVAAIRVLLSRGSLAVRVLGNMLTAMSMKESLLAVSPTERVLTLLPMVVSIKAG